MNDPTDSSLKTFFMLTGIGLLVSIAIGVTAYFSIRGDSKTSEQVASEKLSEAEISREDNSVNDGDASAIAVREDQKVGAFSANGVEFPAQPSDEEYANNVLPQAQKIALAPYEHGTTDPAIGEVAPELSGTDFAGNPVEIKADSRPKVIYFIAHWCNACQQEVPEIQEMLDDGLLPEGLDIYSISSQYQPGAGNSPEIWLHREGWTPPVMRDDQASTAFTLFGATGAPAFVYLDGENKVVYRSSGAIGRERTLALWQQAAAGTLQATSQPR